MARRRGRLTPIVALSGFSGAGKTRLVARLVPALARRGVRVAVLKHTGHDHAFDVPGKDTFVAREAGAVWAAIAGPAGVGFFGPPVKGIRALAALGPPVDLILAEGWKQAPLPRVEVHRRSVNRAFLCAEDRRVFAVVSDEPPPRPLPCFDADDAEGLAALLCARLGRSRRGGWGNLPGGRAVSRVAAGERPSAPRGASMAKTSSRSSRKGSTARRGTTRGSTTRSRTASKSTRSAAGRKGGNATLRARGPEFYSEIGRKGGKASGGARSRRSGTVTRRKAPRRGGRTQARSRGRGKR